MTDNAPSALEAARSALQELIKVTAEFDLGAAAKRATDFNLPAQDWLKYASDCVEYCQKLAPLAPSAGPLGLVEEAIGIVSSVRDALQALAAASVGALAGSGGSGSWSTIDTQMRKLCRGSVINPNAERPDEFDIRRRLRDLISYLLATSQQQVDMSAQVAATRDAHAKATMNAKEVEKILHELQDAPGRWTSLKFSAEFKSEANSQQTAAWFFFVAGVLVAIGLTTFLAASVWWDKMAMPNRAGAALVAEVTARGILVLVWLGVITFLFRQYRASAHMAATNRHRAAVLKTYDLIVRSTEDQPTRAALLREAATCIFQPGNTGLLDQKDDLAHQQLLELVRDVALKKS